MGTMPPLLPKARVAVKAGVAQRTAYTDLMRQLFAIAVLLPNLAFAGDTTTDTTQLYPTMPGVDYYCTDAEGKRVEMGQVICITASCQTWMAKCDMSLNNPTWRKIQDGCPAVTLIDRLKQMAAG